LRAPGNGNIVLNELKFNVAQLLRDPLGASRIADIAVDLYQLAPELAAEQENLPAAALQGHVRLMHTNAGILARGRLSATATAACARCLEPVSVPLAFDLEEVYTPTIDIISGKSVKPIEEDEALWIDEHHILDLAEVLRQDVLVAMPLQVLCRQDCKGLCPSCGQNFNQGSCTCQADTDPRWDVLADLLKNQNQN
jgi:uncharacterized protein